ncbi:MAG: GTP-binding protein [Muribaculaceae bacterium]|nr:GTP-binding protein [Muribaculaceae bacterium]
MKESKEIPVLLLTGYLGSGKTTLLNHILNNKKGIRFAVIVNDLGEVNIDADLIQKGGIVGQDSSGDLVALQNGCICCTLQMDLIKQIDDLLATRRFDYIVIEASGVCEPAPIAQTICRMEQMISPAGAVEEHPRLDAIVTVVDALRLRDEFGCGENLQKNEIDEEDIENLIIEQIEFCNIILLNKISEVTPKEAAHIKSVIRALQPRARILECDYCDVPLVDLLDTHLFDFEDVATSATWVQKIEGPAEEQMEDEHHHHEDEHHHHEDEHHHHEDEHHHHEHEEHHHEIEQGDHHHDYDHGPRHGEQGHNCDGHCHHHHHHGEGEAEEYGIGTYVYFRRRPFDFHKFDRFVNLHWPKNIIRSKGVIYFSHNKDMSLLFETAGKQVNLKEAGYWYATAPREELEIMMMRDPNLRRDWDEEYGDRMIKLVFIGRDLDREKLAQELDACLA